MLFDEKIRKLYETLPGSERSVADVMLEFPGDVVIYASSELASRAGSSNSAVSRLIKRLGYKDYREIQLEARDAQIKGIALYRTTTKGHNASLSDGYAGHLEQEKSNLTATFETLQSEEFQQAIDATLAARKIWVIGFRNGYFFASYLRRHLNLMRKGVGLLPVDGQSVMEDLAEAGPQDIVVAIGLRRRAPQLKECMKLLHEMKVPIVYFTDHRTVSSLKYARWSFLCQSTGSSLFDSCISTLSVLNLFCTEIHACGGKDTQQHLARTEKYVNALSEADNDN